MPLLGFIDSCVVLPPRFNLTKPCAAPRFGIGPTDSCAVSLFGFTPIDSWAVLLPGFNLTKPCAAPRFGVGPTDSCAVP